MTVVDRLAGAPISWGVCEVPGWGAELPVERVLREMRQLALEATELGSPGYFPDEPHALGELMAVNEMSMIGGFVPLVLHEPDERSIAIDAAHTAAKLMSGAGGTLFITSPVMTWDWGPREELSDAQWSHLYEMLAVVDELVAEYSMMQAIHPHLGTVLERRSDVERVLENTTVGWTLDTGHMLIGGTDPVQFARDASDRVVHVHLKDAHLDLAAPVFEGEQSIMEGVQNGMFCNLGQGDVPVAEVINELEGRGYDGWYVLEQDAAITGGMPPEGSGPLLDVQASIEFLRGVDAALATQRGVS